MWRKSNNRASWRLGSCSSPATLCATFFTVQARASPADLAKNSARTRHSYEPLDTRVYDAFVLRIEKLCILGSTSVIGVCPNGITPLALLPLRAQTPLHNVCPVNMLKQQSMLAVHTKIW